MPYVLTTKRVGIVHAGDGQEGPFEAMLSRRAVEELKVVPLLDALRPVLGIGSIRAWVETLQALLDLREAGGTLTLADGTLLEVERQPDAFDVDAFNARHA